MTVKLTLIIHDGHEALKEAMNSINPDNDASVRMELIEDQLTIEIKELKVSSIYNVSEDILRCYELSKKIREGL